MARPPDHAAAFHGHHLKAKMGLALTLTSVIPWLILTYLLSVHVLPLLDAQTHRVLIGALHGLLGCTALLMAGGGYVIWEVAAAVVRTAQLIADHADVRGVEGRCDEIGVLMASFSRLLTTIEAQAAQIKIFSTQLDAAYRDLEATNRRLKELSSKDDVPELYNRRFFLFRLEEEISRSRRFGHPLSLVRFDLEGLRTGPHDLGALTGDETLQEVAQLVVQHARAENVISRYHGDGLAILLVNTPKAGALDYAAHMRQLVAAYPFSHGRQVTASVGIASVPEDNITSADELIRAADEALAEAKTALSHP